MFEVTDTNLVTDLCLQNSYHSIWHLKSFGTNLPRTLITHSRKHKSASPCIVGNFSTTAVQRGCSAECSRHLVREIVEVSTPITTTWKHPLPFTCSCEQATEHIRVVTNSIPDSETLKLIIILVYSDTPEYIIIQTKIIAHLSNTINRYSRLTLHSSVPQNFPDVGTLK
jgi:hypothetical protein